jgi:cation diffusion facilitator CzcD-associated flavoprotein CzcO
MSETVDVLIIGAGQAGLAVSHELTALGIEHVVLDRGRVAQTWRDRWESFCLVTPNATIRLPGAAYAGDDPDGFMRKDEIVRHFERWAASFRAPVREGVTVTSLEAADDRGFRLQTSDGALHARSVVVCSGAYQRPHRPTLASTSGVVELDAVGYTNEAALPPGKVLVVGSGQTGCQLAEELHEAGRVVVLACGRAPWVPRRVGGRDAFYWLIDAGFFDQRVEELPSPAARLAANAQTTGHHGGRDLNYRVLRAAGVTLAGHFLGAEDGQLHFASDLADSVAFGDARYADLRTLILDHCRRNGIDAPELPDPSPFDPTASERLPLDGFGAILYTSGFRPDYTTWMQVDAFDDMGFPVQANGASPTIPGLSFCGVHFLRKRKSSLLMGVGEDAAIVAESIAARRA